VNGVFFDVEADFGCWRPRQGRSHELADGIKKERMTERCCQPRAGRSVLKTFDTLGRNH
jgi:hypothetical protein